MAYPASNPRFLLNYRPGVVFGSGIGPDPAHLPPGWC